MRLDTLFLRKLGVAFLVGALPTLLAFVASVGVHGGSFSRAALLTVAAGAVGAGLRAAMVLIPGVNLIPSDSQPVLVPKTSTSAPKKP